ncbi:MAG: hypothetical protein HQ500_03770 [Flavobacteriales bacterium]|nr:hypothetical protein [Flavobacteriales bacterium]
MRESDKQISELKELILNRASVKQDVYAVTKEVFAEMKDVLGDIAKELSEYVNEADARVVVSTSSEGLFENQMTLGGDTIVLHMHTNVFTFPPSHMMHKHSYVAKHPERAYCGIINIYNFLTDSFRFRRMNDSGYLIGRIFLNHERHFFVEGRGKLGIRFNDFGTAVLNKVEMRDILETVLVHALNFELFTPPYHSVDQVLLSDIQELSQNLKLQTAKRLGFRFQKDEDGTVEF